MPVAPGLRSSGWISGNNARVGSKEGVEWQPVVLVVILGRLIAACRADRNVPSRHLREVYAQAMARGFWQGIHEAVHQVALGGCQFRVLAAAWIDGERLAAERR